MLLTKLCSLPIVLVISGSGSSLSWFQPPSRSACKIIAFEARTSQAKNGNLKPQLWLRRKYEDLLVCLVVIVLVFRMLYRVSNQLLKSRTLANKLNEFGYASTAAQHDKFFLFEKEILDRAAIFLVQQLIDLLVTPIITIRYITI